MQMGTIASLTRKWFGREGCPQAATECNATGGLAVQHMIIGRTQRRRVPDGYFLLPMALFRMIMLYLHALCFKCANELDHIVMRVMEAGDGGVEAVIDRY